MKKIIILIITIITVAFTSLFLSHNLFAREVHRYHEITQYQISEEYTYIESPYEVKFAYSKYDFPDSINWTIDGIQVKNYYGRNLIRYQNWDETFIGDGYAIENATLYLRISKDKFPEYINSKTGYINYFYSLTESTGYYLLAREDRDDVLEEDVYFDLVKDNDGNYRFLNDEIRNEVYDVLVKKGGTLTASRYLEYVVNGIVYEGKVGATDDKNTIFIQYYANDTRMYRIEINKNSNIVKTINYEDDALEVIIKKDIYTTADLLPETFKNELGKVSFDVVDTSVVVNIEYDQIQYKLLYIFEDDTDMDIFSTREAYFINKNNTPQIFINKSDRLYLKDILEAPVDERPAFVPHVIWDLNTNMLENKEKYATNIYIKNTKDGVMVAYVYIDEYIIDQMISTTISWSSRTRKEYWWGIANKYSEYERYQATFTNNDYLEYHDLTAHWTNHIPPLSLLMGIYKEVRKFTMPRIDAINFNDLKNHDITKSEVEKYFSKVNEDFKELKENPRYKLWAIALEPDAVDENSILFNTVFGSVINQYTEFYNNQDDPDDPNNLQIINIDYITNNQLYEAIGSDMKHYVSVNPKLVPKESDVKDSLLSTIIFFIAFGLYMFAIFASKAFTLKKWISLTIIFVILYVGGFFLYKYIKSGKLIFSVIRLL